MIVHLKDTGRALFFCWTDRLSLTSGHTGELRCWPIKCYKAINQSTCFVCYSLLLLEEHITATYQLLTLWYKRSHLDHHTEVWMLVSLISDEMSDVQQLHRHKMSDINSYTRMKCPTITATHASQGCNVFSSPQALTLWTICRHCPRLGKTPGHQLWVNEQADQCSDGRSGEESTN